MLRWRTHPNGLCLREAHEDKLFMFNGAHLHSASEYMVSWYTGHSATEYRCRMHIIINAIITVWHTPANLSNASSFFTLIVINILKCQRHTEPGVRTLLYHLSWFFVIYWYKLPPAISSCSPPTCSLVFLFRGRSSHSTVPLAPHPSKHIFNKELYLLFYITKLPSFSDFDLIEIYFHHFQFSYISVRFILNHDIIRLYNHSSNASMLL